MHCAVICEWFSEARRRSVLWSKYAVYICVYALSNSNCLVWFSMMSELLACFTLCSNFHITVVAYY